MISGPVLRPAASRGPGLERCHRSRLWLDDGDLVLRARSKTCRYPVGRDGGITRAVFVDAGGDDAAGRMGAPITGSWGEVQLQGENGQLIGRFDIEDWLPESPALPKRYLRGEQLLGRTGVAALMKTAGIPMHTVTDKGDPLLARQAHGRGKSLAPGAAFPSWYVAVRAAAGLVWFGAFTAVVLGDVEVPWLILLLAGAALVGPVARLALRAWTRWCMWRYAPVVHARITPSPAAGCGATVRFCRDTELRVQDRDLVLRDLSGAEYWLPLGCDGASAVTSLVLVRDRKGTPLGVELRGGDGQVRAVLQWQLWFGGAGGADAWTHLKRVTNLSTSERVVSGKGIAWPKHPALGLEVLPASAKDARSLSRFPGTIAGISSTAIMALGSFLSLGLGIRIGDAHPGAGRAAILMGALGAVLQAVPYAVHQLLSRTRLDRPAPERMITK